MKKKTDLKSNLFYLPATLTVTTHLQVIHLCSESEAAPHLVFIFTCWEATCWIINFTMKKCNKINKLRSVQIHLLHLLLFLACDFNLTVTLYGDRCKQMYKRVGLWAVMFPGLVCFSSSAQLKTGSHEGKPPVIFFFKLKITCFVWNQKWKTHLKGDLQETERTQSIVYFPIISGVPTDKKSTHPCLFTFNIYILYSADHFLMFIWMKNSIVCNLK